MNSSSLMQRLWCKDPSLWSQDPQEHAAIVNRLGWLDVKQTFTPALKALAHWEKTVDFQDIVLLGMGGSSLAAEVFTQMLPPEERKRTFYVLDTTDTYAIQTLQNQVDFSQALFVVASKSGSTLEVHSLLEYAWQQSQQGHHFVAITDAGSKLEAIAQQRGFLRTFVNPSNIGGRFSALSFFGLVPLVLMGADIERLFRRLDVDYFALDANDAYRLAYLLYKSFQSGKDKLILTGTDSSNAMAVWIEQLVAESTGKKDLGILPVIGSDLADQHEDCHIHVFSNPKNESLILNLDSVTTLKDFYDVGREMLRWEIATSILSHWLQINPFDQPHVELAKKQTHDLLNVDNPQQFIQQELKNTACDPEKLADFLSHVETPGYISILSYLPENAQTHQKLIHLQKKWSHAYQVTVTLGRGPRYLHSTGQYHKGGPKHGHFVVLTQHQPSLRVPGQLYDFNTLKLSQALGDIKALTKQRQKVFLRHYD